MANYHKPNSHISKKKVSISYIIREKEEKCHRAGVNSLQYDPYLDRLYSAGRDSVMRIWDFDSRANTNGTNSSHQNGYKTLRPKNFEDDHFVQSMEHHTDWVNDITLCCNGRNLISVSNDTTIKVWNAHQGFCLSTLRSHKDYAKCLAYAKEREVVASAGFDKMIYLWDIQALTMLTATNNTVTTKPLDGSKNSIYSLAINQTGTLVASGSTEKVIRLWDPRSRQKLLKLRGHTDNVRSLLFSRDGCSLLSASSDGTIRLWSISQQRCVAIIRTHDEGVWTLQANDSFSRVYSGGNDCKIFMTDLKDTSNSRLVCNESSPILKILLVDKIFEDDLDKSSKDAVSSLWVSTTDSAIKNWPIILQDVDEDDARSSRDVSRIDKRAQNESPINTSPSMVIKGNPAVINYYILNDKRHILTLESDNSVALYDILTARKIETLHPPDTLTKARENYELEIKNRFKMVYVPNWFTVDLKIGLLCIHLEENECFAAWVSARDYGLETQADGSQDPKINLGCLMLQALLRHWPPTYDNFESDYKGATNDARPDSVNLDDQNSLNYMRTNPIPSRLKNSNNDRNLAPYRVGSQHFLIPGHTTIILSEGNQTTLRFLAHEACNENESMFIFEMLPSWIGDTVISRCQPKFTKIPFFLLPHANSGIKSLRKERLSASDMLQMRKVIEHVCEKMIVNLTDETNGVNSSHDQGSSLKSNIYPVDKVELYCNDQKLDENMDLRTVRHYIWKSGGDLVLHYMPIK